MGAPTVSPDPEPCASGACHLQGCSTGEGGETAAPPRTPRANPGLWILNPGECGETAEPTRMQR
eukprot:5459908-Alexandrium_andersonii.AAC.1